MIYVIDGRTGHGKTAYAMKWVRKLLLSGQRIYSNTKINPENMFSDRKFKKLFKVEKIKDQTRLSKVEGDIFKKEDRDNPDIRILYWQNFSDWQFMSEGTILCDEGIVYFNSRKWEELPEGMSMKLVQHRKDKLDLLLTVQHFSFVDKQLRMLCEAFIHVDLKLGSANFKKSFIPRVAKTYGIDLPTLMRCENLGIDPYRMTAEDKKKMRLEQVDEKMFWIKRKIFSWYDTGAKMVESRPEKLIHRLRTCPTCSFERVSHS